MSKKCPKCSFDGNAAEWEFCGRCGTDLATADADTIVTTTPSVITDEPKAPPAKKSRISERKVDALAKLVVTRNGRIGQEFPINGESCLIGRWDADAGSFPEVDLSDDDPGPFVSRQHARVFIKGSRYYIEDLGSNNGTVLNKGDRLKPHAPMEIKNADEIIIGKVFLQFVLE